MATIKDKIGLAMIPSVYDGGISTSETDFSGTVHSLLPIQHESPNLATNGTFDTDSDWLKVGVVNISNGVATLDGDGQTSLCYQSNIIEEGKSYIATFQILNYNGLGEARVIDDNGTPYYTVTQDGVFTISFEAKVHNSGNFLFRAKNGALFSIDNVSVQLVSNGDFDFERSSAATRVGSDGYIKDVQVIGEELVQNRDFEDVSETELITNGGFDADSNWNGTSANGVSISNGSLNYSNTTLNHNVSQGSVVVIGRPYKLTFTISNYEKGSILPILGAGGSLQEVSGDGTFTMYGTASINTVFYFQARGTNGTTLSIDNVSVKEVGQNWTFGTGWSIEDDGGDLKAISDTTQSNLTSDATLVSGKKYKFSLSTSSVSTGSYSFLLRFNTTNTNIGVINSDGSHEFIVEADSTSFRLQTLSGATTSFIVDNISVVEITDDTDIPRLDYSDGAQPALLLEPKRRNKIQYSENLQLNTSPTFVQSGPQTLDFGHPSPDGKNNALRISGILPGTSYIALNGGGSGYTRSVYVKTYNGEDAEIKMLDINGQSEIYNINGDWQRIINTSPVDGWIYIVDARGSGTTATDILVFGLQQEDDGNGGNTDYPTSYIPTNGSTVTRLADVCKNAGDSTIFNNAEGVLYAEIKFNETTTNSSTNGISLNDGSSSNRVTLYNNTNNVIDIITPRVYKGGASVIAADVNSTGNPPLKPSNQYNKIAVKYDSNGLYVYANGSFLKQRIGFDCSFPEGTLKSISFDDAGNEMEGNIRSVLYFPEALTDAELKKLTSSTATQVLNNYSTLLSRVGATYESSGLETKLNELL